MVINRVVPHPKGRRKEVNHEPAQKLPLPDNHTLLLQEFPPEQSRQTGRKREPKRANVDGHGERVQAGRHLPFRRGVERLPGAEDRGDEDADRRVKDGGNQTNS